MGTATVVFSAWVMSAALFVLSAGSGHVRRFADLRATIARHALVPQRWRRVMPHVLLLSQIGVSCGVITALLAGRGILALFGALLAAMLWIFLIYETILYRKRRGYSCGCFGRDVPVTRVSIGRTAVMAIVTTVGVPVISVAEFVPSSAQMAMILAAGVTGALVARILPEVTVSMAGR
ncbi:MauE/DoxX family redox-associated membrane protein [Phytoactinopolyspora limicola]|uniref:MauE/DoxX family redox-associated membrane protein n=1 Tax=Phytoactinopolyspora limicola TaxID=2715536 RepID=UPI003CCD9E4E